MVTVLTPNINLQLSESHPGSVFSTALEQFGFRNPIRKLEHSQVPVSNRTLGHYSISVKVLLHIRTIGDAGYAELFTVLNRQFGAEIPRTVHQKVALRWEY